jgi:hypothetical protein
MTHSSDFPSHEEFAELIIRANELETIVDAFLLQGTPYAFREAPAL